MTSQDDKLLAMLFPDNEATANYLWWMQSAGYMLRRNGSQADFVAIGYALAWFMRSFD
jgi:hypothetical protein